MSNKPVTEQKLSEVGSMLGQSFKPRNFWAALTTGPRPTPQMKLAYLVIGVMTVGICIEAKQHSTPAERSESWGMACAVCE